MSRAPEPIHLVALPGIPAVLPGDDLPALIRPAAQRASISLQAGALVVIALLIRAMFEIAYPGEQTIARG